MKYSKKRQSTNDNIRQHEMTNQPEAAKEQAPGYGDKKLDGPNRPST
ncbi:hypothetical protein [Ammoniphilus sp. CFH 90114]|nr:hypothetical protein [Ammoniphilus sp. CFH 90114]